ITIGMFVLQFLIPLLMNGRTLGSRLLRFRLEKVGSDKGRLTAFLKRWFAFMAPWLMYQLFSLVAQYATLDMDSHYYAFNVWMQVILMLLMFVIIFVLCVHILIVLFIRKRHYFYFDDLAGIRARCEQHKRSEERRVGKECRAEWSRAEKYKESIRQEKVVNTMYM